MSATDVRRNLRKAIAIGFCLNAGRKCLNQVGLC
jgi:hypothetical protein